jgi:hypothetical protein
MKSKVFGLVFTVLISTISSHTFAYGEESRYEVPVMESFTVSPTTVDLSAVSPKLDFMLKISHPIGIRSNQTTLWFKSQDKRFIASTKLIKSDSVVISKRVLTTFKGTLEIPSNFDSGLYDFYAESIEGMPGGNLSAIPSTQDLYPEKFSDFIDGEKSVIVRIAGELNSSAKTFVGPAYESENYFIDSKPRNLFTSPPITKVNEIYDPRSYFELRVPGIELKVESFTTQICKVVDNKLLMVETGLCDFRIFTQKNLDYLESSFKLSFTVTGARWKPEIDTPKIADQNSKDLPKLLETTKAYSNTGELVSPVSLTPAVCLGAGQYWVKILGGGTCTLSYKTQATNNNLESDTYKVSFEVKRDPQSITFALPANANLSTKTLALSATASGGGVITYQSTSVDICSITGSTLNLLKGGNCAITATQAGSATLAPISATATVMIAGSVAPTKKTITCVKGNKTKKVSGTNPKCPKGYKIKR